MKLTDFLSDVGRPVAYYPALRRITGSTNATIFLCQLIYWKGKEADPQGWIYKTSEEMEAETGLSYDEQKTARTKLKEAGLIEEHYARLDHQMKFRLNIEAIDATWGSPVPESRITALGKAESPNSLSSNTENTTENKDILKTDELQGIYELADKKVDAILEFEKQAHAAEEAGQAYRGREFLVGTDFLPYGDWYHKVTGWQMYPKKGKAKQDSTVMTEFKKWWENDLTLEALQTAYDIENGWRKDKSGLAQNITHPRELTAKAIAVNAAPNVKSTPTETKVYRAEDEPQKEYVPAPERKR